MKKVILSLLLLGTMQAQAQSEATPESAQDTSEISYDIYY